MDPPTPFRAQPAARDENSYALFLPASIASVLLVGLGAGIWLAFAESAGDAALILRLRQIHGFTQSAAFIGLAVCGMSLRLVPRILRLPPLPVALTRALFAATAAGLVLHLFGAATGEARTAAAGMWLLALATGTVAAILLIELGRKPRGEAWWISIVAGGLGWVVVALLEFDAALNTHPGGLLPESLERSLESALIFAVGANFAWAVQLRMVRVLFGRGRPAWWAVLPAVIVFNLGVWLGVTDPSLPAAALTGIGMVALAATAGSVRGRATRINPAAAALGTLIVWANRWALLAGLLLVLELPLGALRVDVEPLADAALHASGLGFLALLIVAMATLLVPSLAAERMQRTGPNRSLTVLILLMTATVVRVAAELSSSGLAPGLFAALLAASGIIAWAALAIFALELSRSILRPTRARLA